MSRVDKLEGQSKKDTISSPTNEEPSLDATVNEGEITDIRRCNLSQTQATKEACDKVKVTNGSPFTAQFSNGQSTTNIGIMNYPSSIWKDSSPDATPQKIARKGKNIEVNSCPPVESLVGDGDVVNVGSIIESLARMNNEY